MYYENIIIFITYVLFFLHLGHSKKGWNILQKIGVVLRVGFRRIPNESASKLSVYFKPREGGILVVKMGIQSPPDPGWRGSPCVPDGIRESIRDVCWWHTVSIGTCARLMGCGPGCGRLKSCRPVLVAYDIQVFLLVFSRKTRYIVCK